MVNVVAIKMPKQSELHLHKSYYIRFEGYFMTCYSYKVIQKPLYNTVYLIEYSEGLWILKDAGKKLVMNSFELKSILSYCVKVLK